MQPMTRANHTQPSHFNSSVQMAFLLSYTMRQETLFNVALLFPSLYSWLSSMTEKLTSVWQLTHQAGRTTSSIREHTMISTVSCICSCIIKMITLATYVALFFPSLYTRLSNMHSKQALSPIHEICRFLWILMAKKLFVRVSSSDSWRAICADDFKAKSCALRLFHATDTCQTLAYVIHGGHPLLRRSFHFSVATV